jgi:glucose/arabinose dehydrogenase
MRLVMKSRLLMLCLTALSTVTLSYAQTPAPDPAAASASELTGRPPGVPRNQSHNTVGFPAPATVEGQPIETRPPEKQDDAPAFSGQTRAPYHASAPYNVTVVTDRLKLPWSLAFLPDGKMLVTEKPGNIRLVDGSGAISAPLTGTPSVNYQGQVGLLDVALDRSFSRNHRIFFTYSEVEPGDTTAIVVSRATLDEAAGTLSDAEVIFRAKPGLPRAVSTNQGGRIAVASDGTLFVTIGDRASVPPWNMAQKLDNDLGKIIHINPDGSAARGNPFAHTEGALPEIWTYGSRSEEGLAFAPSGQLWETENGPRGGDKLIKVMPGQNYGWPVIVHGLDYSGDPVGAGITQKEGLTQPRYYWDPVIAPSGLAFYHGTLFPAWRHSVFVGALRGVMLDRLELDGDKVVAEEPMLVDQHARVRDVRVGPEGAVYVLTDNGKLLKLTPR